MRARGLQNLGGRAGHPINPWQQYLQKQGRPVVIPVQSMMRADRADQIAVGRVAGTTDSSSRDSRREATRASNRLERRDTIIKGRTDTRSLQEGATEKQSARRHKKGRIKVPLIDQMNSLTLPCGTDRSRALMTIITLKNWSQQGSTSGGHSEMISPANQRPPLGDLLAE